MNLPPDVLEFFRQQGAKGGKIGGKRSLETMTPEQRQARARKASAAAVMVRHSAGYRLEIRRGHTWEHFRTNKKYLGAIQNGSHFSRVYGRPMRLIYQGRVIREWLTDTKEQIQWRDAKRKLEAARKQLREPSHSPPRASIPEPTSPR